MTKMRVTCEDESNVFLREEKTEDQDQHNSYQRITPGFLIEKLVIFSINDIFYQLFDQYIGS